MSDRDERLAQIRAWERSGKATALFDIYADIRFLLAELDAATQKLADYEAAAKYPGDDQRHRGASVASQLVHAQHMREQAEAERDEALAHNAKLTERVQQLTDAIKRLKRCPFGPDETCGRCCRCVMEAALAEGEENCD